MTQTPTKDILTITNAEADTALKWLTEHCGDQVKACMTRRGQCLIHGDRAGAMVEKLVMHWVLQEGLIVKILWERFRHTWEAFGLEPDEPWDIEDIGQLWG